jgi:hypothetical protein
VIIVGIHADMEGEVETAAKLDAKIAIFRKGIWHGKDLPFSVALTSVHRAGDAKVHEGPAGQYGIQSWPTTILIDPEGKVVGRFHARDVKAASEQIDKLLREKK